MKIINWRIPSGSSDIAIGEFDMIRQFKRTNTKVPVGKPPARVGGDHSGPRPPMPPPPRPPCPPRPIPPNQCNMDHGDFEKYLDEMEARLNSEGILSQQYIIQLKMMYRAFMYKYPIGSYISFTFEGSIVDGHIDQYRLDREEHSGHILIYIRDEDGNLSSYLLEDVAKAIAPENPDSVLNSQFVEYLDKWMKMVMSMNELKDAEAIFNNKFRVMYPVNTDVGFYRTVVTIVDYYGEDNQVVEVKDKYLKDQSGMSVFSKMPISELYAGMMDFKSSGRTIENSGNY